MRLGRSEHSIAANWHEQDVDFIDAFARLI